MPLSARETVSDCLSLEAPIRIRRDLFGRLGDFSGELKLRGQLQKIRRHHCDFALPPKYIPPHPRLSPLPAIHFDHYNSSVTDMPGPTPGEVEVASNLYAEAIAEGTIVEIAMPGTCLNFLLDHEGNLYGFCGELVGLGTKVAFKLTLFNEHLGKIGDREIVRFKVSELRSREDLVELGLASPSEPPVRLGYFVMDREGRVIVVENDTDIVFLKKNAADEIEPVQMWRMRDQLRGTVRNDIADQPLAQVLPAYDRGYWIMALGDEDGLPAYLGSISDGGRLEDVYVFPGQIIENGMAVDHSGVYVVTDHELYKFARTSGGGIDRSWHEEYCRASEVKPGTESLSRRGSGSTPTLLGEKDDLVAITDNDDFRVNLRVFDRKSGREKCREPLFERHESANENTVVGYGDSIIVQNFYDAPRYDEAMWGIKPGLMRFDVKPDRTGCDCVWDNKEFASTATVRLSTRTGLLYGTIQTGEDDQYAMAFIDFETGDIVQEVPFPDSGKGYRIAMSPTYFVPGGRLVQPVRQGIVVFSNP